VTTSADDVVYEEAADDRRKRKSATVERQREWEALRHRWLAAYRIPDATPAGVNRANGPEPTTRAGLSFEVAFERPSANRVAVRSDPLTQPEFHLRRRPLEGAWPWRQRVTRKRPPVGTFVRKQEWIGRVERVLADRIFVSLTDRTSPNEEEVAELSLEEVSARDRELVQPGALFYWIIGYRDAADGQRRSESLLRFRRPIEMTREEREAARVRARALRQRVGGRDPATAEKPEEA
jgi:hypothetical protein